MSSLTAKARGAAEDALNKKVTMEAEARRLSAEAQRLSEEANTKKLAMESQLAASKARLDEAKREKHQKIVRIHCERGNHQAMVETTAEVLLRGHMPSRIPEPVGVKTKDLLDRAEQAIVEVVEEYRSAGGVLLAKGYVGSLGLAAEMGKQWLASFVPEIQEAHPLRQLEDDQELNARLTLVAKAVLICIAEKTPHGKKLLEGVPRDQVLAKRKQLYADIIELMSTDPGRSVCIEAADLDGLSKKAARAMLRAFTHPNEEIHRLVHGAEP